MAASFLRFGIKLQLVRRHLLVVHLSILLIVVGLVFYGDRNLLGHLCVSIAVSLGGSPMQLGVLTTILIRWHYRNIG